MRFRHGLLLLALMPAAAMAWGDDCKFTADRAEGVDARGVEKVVIRAGAGALKVLGPANATRIEARGVACAAKQDLLDNAQISVRREGNTVYVETNLPQDGNGWSFMRNDYAYMNLGVALPSSLPVEAIDSSGEAAFEDLAALNLQDSSGNVDIRRVAGLVDVTDSSGDLVLENVGSVRISDSSGEVRIQDVRGGVDIDEDSSGDIRVLRTGGSVHVRQDSSGNIRIEDVRGNVDVDEDSSGDIYAAQVSGNFTVRDDGSGSIGHNAITGRVEVPQKD
jgi:DUF4097 and DUF4098 domain-containing protein YvlB